MSTQQIAGRYVGAIDESEVFGVADREVDFDGVQLGNGCEERLRADKVPNLGRSLARYAAHERADLCKAQVQLGCRERGFSSPDRRFCRGHGRIRLFSLLVLVVELALRNRSRHRKRNVALQVDLGETLLCLSLRELAFCLVYLRLRLVD